MGKLAQNFAKYVIVARLKASGVVEKPDIIGAIFGQTEGLLGNDLDLRELQRTGRVGRIEVEIKRAPDGASEAEVTIPCSLDASETSLIASSLETIDKVGPCEASIKVEKVEDVRSVKRRYAVDRAKEILQTMISDGSPGSNELTEMIREAVRTCEVGDYFGLSCGPDIENADEITVVEGRADVINLLKNGVRNVIAIDGSKIPDALIKLTQEKITTAFVDGDRGGTLDLKKLLSVANIDYVTRAEDGYEVEELTKKQIYKALREKIPTDKLDKRELKDAEKPVADYVEKRQKAVLGSEAKKFFKESIGSLIGTRAVVLANDSKVIAKIPLSELLAMINDYPNTSTIILDSKINQSLVDMALQRKIRFVVGTEVQENLKYPDTMCVLSINDLA
ncbi:MAG: DNA primase DnaG [Candidatus Aenigmatarchaeota archaeon]